MNGAGENRYNSNVSIPIWYGLNHVREIEKYKLPLVSIPIWYGLNRKPVANMKQGYSVSIPIWYGLNWVSLRHHIVYKGFNSNMVRLKSYSINN